MRKILFSQVEFKKRNGLDYTQTLIGDICIPRSTSSSFGKRLIDQKKNLKKTTNAHEARLASNQPKYVI
jgi:hypothetical protein